MKTILITGSTDGIGKLTAIALAKDGHHVLLHGRTPQKLEATIKEVKQESHNTDVDGFVGDFAELDSIQSLVDAIAQKHPKLDVLINNAGVFISPVTQTKKGLDIRFAVNYLAPYLLTNGLLKLLKASSAPRVINLSSAAQTTVSIDALLGKTIVSTQAAYAQSKLALTMWSFYLSETFDYMTTIAVNPGSLLNTKMAQEAYGQHWSSANKGADILYDLAISEQHENSSGLYFDNDKGMFAKAHVDAYDDEKIATLISETEQLIKL